MASISPALDTRHASPLALLIAPLLPVLVFAYPLLVWPLMYAVPVDQVTGLEAPASEVAFYALNRLYFPPLLVAAFLCFIGSRARLPAGNLSIFIPLFLLGLICGLSALWALAPEISARRFLLQVAIVGTLLFSIASIRHPKTVLEPIFWLLVITLAVNLFAVATRTPGPIGYEGIYPQKNTLGAVAAVALLFSGRRLLTGHMAGRLVALGAVFAAIVLLFLSQSKTSIGLVLLAPLAAFALFAVCRLLRLSAALVVISGFLFVALGFAYLSATYDSTLGTIFDAAVGDKTLTGRSAIWGFAGGYIDHRPWLGYGYQSFWNIGPISPNLREAPGFIAKMPNAHNGYIDVIIQVGIVGFAAFMALLLASFGKIGALCRSDGEFGYFLLTLAVFIGLHNFLETHWFEGFRPLSMLFAMVILLAVFAKRVNPDQKMTG